MIDDTVYAVASPPGVAARGVIRLSGSHAFELAGRMGLSCARERGSSRGSIRLGVGPVPCTLHVMPGPGSYTGEDTVELHLPGSPAVLSLVQEALAGAACAEPALAVRPAQPGEFTRRAFTSGRLDLAAAEGVLDLIHAASEQERSVAWSALSGGLSHRVTALRSRIQDILAWIESGLDFGEEETGAVARSTWLPGLEQLVADHGQLLAELPRGRAAAGGIALLGPANAGKSSLANALAGRDALVVSDAAGTTRDVVAIEIAPGVILLDGPGDLAAPDLAADRAALGLRDRLLAGVGAALLVVDGTVAAPLPAVGSLPVVAVVHTKADLGPSAAPCGEGVPTFGVSARNGSGLAALREFLGVRAGVGGGTGGVAARMRTELVAAHARVVAARDAATAGVLDELVAMELREALTPLDRVHGRSSPEDVLDRVFGQFCLGK